MPRRGVLATVIEELGYILSSLPLRLGLRLTHFAYLEKWVLLGTLMGIAGGLSAIAFTNLLRIFESLFQGIYHGVLDGNRLLYPLIPALGGLISGLLVYTFAPEAEGHGTDSVIDAIHRRWCRIRWRVPLIKSLASAVTISSGGSAGKEGPIAQIAAGVGAVLSDVLRLNLRDKRVALISGLAAGIGSIFKSPLGASIFAVEVMYKRDFEVEALIPAVLSSIISYTIYCLYDGWEPVLSHPEYVYKNPVELVFFLVTGVVAGLVAVAYVKVFYGMRDAFALLRIPNHVKPAIGGLSLGLLAIAEMRITGSGYGVISGAMRGDLGMEEMLELALLKILATSLTISSGGSGGVFAPSLFIGATLGGFLGSLYSSLLPWLDIQPTAYTVIGMASFFAGAAKVPLTSVIMTAEMTGGYTFMVPVTFASAVAYILTGDVSIYEKQVADREHRPA